MPPVFWVEFWGAAGVAGLVLWTGAKTRAAGRILLLAAAAGLITAIVSVVLAAFLLGTMGWAGSRWVGYPARVLVSGVPSVIAALATALMVIRRDTVGVRPT